MSVGRSCLRADELSIIRRVFEWRTFEIVCSNSLHKAPAISRWDGATTTIIFVMKNYAKAFYCLTLDIKLSPPDPRLLVGKVMTLKEEERRSRFAMKQHKLKRNFLAIREVDVRKLLKWGRRRRRRLLKVTPGPQSQLHKSFSLCFAFAYFFSQPTTIKSRLNGNSSLCLPRASSGKKRGAVN